MENKSKVAIYAAIAQDLLMAALKLVVALASGSSAMISECIHSVVDSCTGVLLLVGERRSHRQPTALHPFGHGLEHYFWTLIVAILVFLLGGAISIFEGIVHLQNPRIISNSVWTYAVLAISFVTELVPFVFATKAFLREKKWRGIWETIRQAKDPTIFTLVFDETAGLLGVILAFVAIYLGQRLQNPYFDGGASICIGLILVGMSVVLVRESKDLIIGESAPMEVVRAIQSHLEQDEALHLVTKIRTLQLGPKNIMLVAQIAFPNHFLATDIVATSERIKSDLGKKFADIKYIFFDVQRCI